CFVFFPAEDGIRDFHVTGVQTCALPIWVTDSLLGRREQLEGIFHGVREHPCPLPRSQRRERRRVPCRVPGPCRLPSVAEDLAGRRQQGSGHLPRRLSAR